MIEKLKTLGFVNVTVWDQRPPFPPEPGRVRLQRGTQFVDVASTEKDFPTAEQIEAVELPSEDVAHEVTVEQLIGALEKKIGLTRAEVAAEAKAQATVDVR